MAAIIAQSSQLLLLHMTYRQQVSKRQHTETELHDMGESLKQKHPLLLSHTTLTRASVSSMPPPVESVLSYSFSAGSTSPSLQSLYYKSFSRS